MRLWHWLYVNVIFSGYHTKCWDFGAVEREVTNPGQQARWKVSVMKDSLPQENDETMSVLKILLPCGILEEMVRLTALTVWKVNVPIKDITLDGGFHYGDSQVTAIDMRSWRCSKYEYSPGHQIRWLQPRISDTMVTTQDIRHDGYNPGHQTRWLQPRTAD